MKLSDLTRYYDRLDPDERFRLSLDAMARMDADELARLRRTCPRRHYSMIDPAFLNRLEAAERIATRFAILWLHFTRALRLVEMIAEEYRSSMAMFTHGYTLGHDDGWHSASREHEHAVHVGRSPAIDQLDGITRDFSSESLPEPLNAVYQTRIRELKSLYLGLIGFCERAQIKPDSLMVWWPPIIAEIEHFRVLIDADISADEAMVREIEEVFALLWSGRTNGPHGIDIKSANRQ